MMRARSGPNWRIHRLMSHWGWLVSNSSTAISSPSGFGSSGSAEALRRMALTKPAARSTPTALSASTVSPTAACLGTRMKNSW